MVSKLLLFLALGNSLDSTAQRAMSDIQAGKYAEAAHLLESALQRQPGDAELCNLLGISYSELHRDGQAEEAFIRGLRAAPDSASLYENLGLLYFREGRYSNAKQVLQHALNIGSASPTVRFSLAAARLRTGEREQALGELRQLESALNSVPDYWIERGRAELPESARDAEASFEKALALAPSNAIALNGAAAAAEQQGLDEKALAYLIRERKAAPDNIETLLHFANLCIRRDLGPDAVDAAERAHILEPNNFAALYLLARANISIQNWQRSYSLFQELTEKYPRFAPGFYALGWIDVKLSRTMEARRAMEHSLELDPKLVSARYDLAQLELADGNVNRARELLTTVLKLSPQDARANMTMGDLEMRAGRLEAARSSLEQAVKSDPKLSAAHFKLATVYARLHENDKAARERTIATQLTAEEKQQSKMQMRLVLPD